MNKLKTSMNNKGTIKNSQVYLLLWAIKHKVRYNGKILGGLIEL